MEQKEFKDENEFNAVVSAIKTQLLTLFDRVLEPGFEKWNAILAFYCEIGPESTGRPVGTQWVYMAYFCCDEYIPFYHAGFLDWEVMKIMPDIHYQFERANPLLFAERVTQKSV